MTTQRYLDRFSALCRRFIISLILGCCILGNVIAREVITIPKRVFGTGDALTAACSPDGKQIVTGNAAGAFLWDATTGNLVRWFPGPIEEVLAVAFSPDGTQIATGTRQVQYEENSQNWAGFLRLRNVANGAQLWEASVPDVPRQISFSPNGQTILSCSLENAGSDVCL
jgi:WD40 repeat protein